MSASDPPPPTDRQLERIGQLLEHPALDDYVAGLGEEKFAQLIKSRGTAGILIAWMKKRVARYESEH